MERYLPDKECIVMTREEVRAFDSWAINTVGIAGVVLMENAGRSCAEFIKERLAGVEKAKVCIFCGTGNNGGDGYVVARHLAGAGLVVRVVICGERNKIKGDAKINLDIIEKMGLAVEQLDVHDEDIAGKVASFAAGCDMLVDGLFGTGLTGRLGLEYIGLIESINKQDCLVIAIDIPSGLDCDSGEPLGAAVRAVATVTFAAVKKGFTLGRCASQYTGQIHVASIGVEPSCRKGGVRLESPNAK